MEEITDAATRRSAVVLAALLIAPTYAQTRAATPVRPGAQAAAQVYFPERIDWRSEARLLSR